MTRRIDFIGDVHGGARQLRELLEHLGYVRRGWNYRHPDPHRTAVFVGDLIDGGPGQVEVYVLVRRMVEDRAAVCLLGNHELDAIGWATCDPKTGWPMIDRTARNWARHSAFLTQVVEGSKLHGDMIRWFKTLPLFLDTGEFRAVHACWHAPSVAALAPCLVGGRVRPDAWPLLLDRGTGPGRALSTLLRGPEFAHPSRSSPVPVRARWWARNAATVAQAAADPDQVDPRTGALPFDASEYLDDGGLPLFFGHYGCRRPPTLVGRNAACVDNHAFGARPLAAYAWSGERILTADGYEMADVPERGRELAAAM